WGNELSKNDCTHDCGHEVPIHVYREDELFKLIRHGKRILTDQGYENPISFLAGGWLGSQQVLEAAAANGIAFDFSSVAPHLLAGRLSGYPLLTWLSMIWTDVTPFTQPYTKPTRSGEVIEVGNSAAMASYLGSDEIINLFKSYVAKRRTTPKQALT